MVALRRRYRLLVFVLAALNISVQGGGKADFTVAVHGGGDFRSIQEALDSLSSYPQTRVVILLRNGTYNEKVFITRSHVSLVGESRDSTRIVFAVLRDAWNKTNGGSDWGAGVINIDTGVTDVTLANLTVYNNYGWKHHEFNKHQFAVRGAGTRIMLLHCNIISDGGDALSLWNKQDGMYYHADCNFEGWVDFVCPRGWCYITNSTFFGHNKPSASIWHDGSANKKQKFVIKNSFFDGVPGFPLGRNHLDAQIFLIGCGFSGNMADRPFYRPPSSPKEWQWGDRHYFYDCHREGGDFAWFSNNLESAEDSPAPSDLTAKWTFDGKWDPESDMPSILPFAFQPRPERNAAGIPTRGLHLNWVPGRNAISHNVYFGENIEPEFNSNQTEATFAIAHLKPSTTYYWRVDELMENTISPGQLWSFTTAKEKGQ